MNDLHRLLDAVAGSTATSVSDSSSDLDRGRIALRERRRHVYSLSLAGLGVAGVLGVGSIAVVGGNTDPAPSTAPAPTPSAAAPSESAPSEPLSEPTTSEAAPTEPATAASEPPVVTKRIRLVAKTLEAGPFTFGTTPRGWELQHNEPFAVTIGPTDGSVDDDPASFVGKLVILLDDNPLGQGDREMREGRDLVVRDNGDGYSTISVRTRDGEPVGVVRIQFPGGVGWTRDAAITFAASVQVGPGAEVIHG